MFLKLLVVEPAYGNIASWTQHVLKAFVFKPLYGNLVPRAQHLSEALVSDNCLRENLIPRTTHFLMHFAFSNLLTGIWFPGQHFLEPFTCDT